MQLFGQNLSNLRSKTVPVRDTIKLDSFSIVPNTLLLKKLPSNQFLTEEDIEIDLFNAIIVIKNRQGIDSIKAWYRVFPYAFTAQKFNKDINQKLESEGGVLLNPFSYQTGSSGPAIDFGELDYSGNFARGISFGNNQDVILNSSFNLQLAGQLTKEIEILAAITDNNIPIQPEGNTQQLQDFDKVYIQLRKNPHQLTVGDIDMRHPKNGYFLRFVKNSQGGNYQGAYDLGQYGNLTTNSSIAVATGQFARNILVTQEGNQGPYKLRGANGESFIIVIAGTERVFLNGEQLERGADRDYVIDYNLGEITFTPKRLITKDLRISVEFQYSERNFFRSIIHLNGEYKYDNLNVRFNFFQEQDNKNQSVQQDLSTAQRNFLENVGDSINNALFPGADSVGFNENRILYEQIDTFLEGIPYTFYRYSTDPERAIYAVSFSQLGAGRGDYVLAASNANGRVYEWRPPIAGVQQGDYEAVVLLVTPKRSQLYSLGADYTFKGNNKITTEVALSNYDVNTFSKLNDEDDRGVAMFAAFENKQPLGSDGKVMMTTEIGYEFKESKFIPIERYRDVEFQRNWSVNSTISNRNEHLGKIKSNFKFSKYASVEYQLQTFVRDSLYKGLENRFNSTVTKNGYQMKLSSSFLFSDNNNAKSNFLRPRLEISKAIKAMKGWRIGTVSMQESRKISRNEVLQSNSVLFHEYDFYLRSPDTMKNQYSFDVKLRYEHQADSFDFTSPIVRAQTYNVKGSLRKNPVQQFNWNITYRNFWNTSDTVTIKGRQNIYLGRLDYNVRLFKGFIRSNSLYEIGSGREQKIEYVFIEAPNGNGSYAWEDLNDNGIQELNEFFISQFPNENRFIRLFNSSTEFISVNFTRFNQILAFNFGTFWRNSKGFKGFIGKISTNHALRLERKLITKDDQRALEPFNPFRFGISDSILVSENTSIRNIVYYNRAGAKFGAEFSLNYSKNKTLLVNGFDSRTQQTQYIAFRYNLLKNLSFNTKYTNGLRTNDSEFFADQRYEVLSNEVEGGVTHILNSRLRTTIKYTYAFKSNPLPVTGGQFTVMNDGTLDMRYNILHKGNITARFSYTNIGYRDGKFENKQVEFAMLQGLQDGNNYIWGISFDRQLSKALQLTIAYDGRKTGKSDSAVHTGRAQIRAIF